MGFFSADIQTMDDLFVHTLRDIYYAEQKILQALPTMIENSANSQLRSAFEHQMPKRRIMCAGLSRCSKCMTLNVRR